MIADTWLLITLRWQVAWNGFLARKLTYKVLTVLAAISFAVIAGGVSALVGFGAGLLVRNTSDRHYDALIPGGILTAVTFLLLLSSFGIAAAYCGLARC